MLRDESVEPRARTTRLYRGLGVSRGWVVGIRLEVRHAIGEGEGEGECQGYIHANSGLGAKIRQGFN